MPDHRIGHLREARNTLGEQLDVEFILATDPGATLHGTVRDYEWSTTLDESQSKLGLGLHVDFDETKIPQLVPGTRVIGKIRCGQRSIGFVWFHDIAEFVQSRILFRLF